MIEHQNTIVVIPARMASARLPGKPMADIHGIPMIVHVWRRAVEANVGRVLVASAEIEIAEAVRAHGGDAIVTTAGLASGTDRVAEALSLRDPEGNFRFVVVLRGDIPAIDPLSVQRCLAGLVNQSADISTIAAELHDTSAIAGPDTVKVLAPLTAGREVAFARDFVRQLPPEAEPPFWRHIGIYAYKRAALERFAALPVGAREAELRLEQLRAIDNGLRIAVVRVDRLALEVDTPANLDIARQLLRTRS
jgi:3-deoxy-manno-octulosonate cytidylyltransferase (CMP-KDO synthetase)